MAEKGDTKMSLEQILTDDRLTEEQRNMLTSFLEKAGAGYLDILTTPREPKQDEDEEEDLGTSEDQQTMSLKDIDGMALIASRVGKLLTKKIIY